MVCDLQCYYHRKEFKSEQQIEQHLITKAHKKKVKDSKKKGINHVEKGGEVDGVRTITRPKKKKTPPPVVKTRDARLSEVAPGESVPSVNVLTRDQAADDVSEYQDTSEHITQEEEEETNDVDKSESDMMNEESSVVEEEEEAMAVAENSVGKKVLLCGVFSLKIT